MNTNVKSVIESLRLSDECPKETIFSRAQIETVMEMQRGSYPQLMPISKEVASTAQITKSLLDQELIRIMEKSIQQNMALFQSRLNQQIFGDGFRKVWTGKDGTEYFDWQDLPDDELLAARLTGKCTSQVL